MQYKGSIFSYFMQYKCSIFSYFMQCTAQNLLFCLKLQVHDSVVAKLFCKDDIF
jgi:hypothetical protein